MLDLASYELLVTLIVVLPLAAAAINGLNLLFGDRFHYTVVQRLTCGSILLSFLGSVWVFVEVLAAPAPREVTLYRWLYSGELDVNVAFLIDSLSAVMMLVVTGFSFLISVFSINYMHRDYSFTRYFTAFALFVFAMLVLVMGNNYVMLFFGWEAVGVCSYLMIGHYYNRVSAAKAGTLAFVMNRVGDAGFLMGIFLIATNFQTVSYAQVFAKLDTIDSATATAIGLCLLLGAVGKSAQLPLGTWLAKAMEGPTPSSALIHAATMVTAGVYMIVRSHELYNMAPNALLVIAIVGAATALYGAMVGSTLSDIKGILAASTTTQLGLMFLACGLGGYVVAIFHLVAHAFLKSYLFLTAPSILHHMHTKADVTKREAVREPVPFLYGVILVVALGLVAFPFMAGWWKSDPAGGAGEMPWYVLITGGIMAAFAVVHYTARLTRKVFIEEAHGHDENGEGHRVPRTIDLVIGPVVVVAVVAGIGVVLGLLPGGAEGTWFRELLAPVVTARALPSGGHPVLASTLMVLLGLMLFGAWFTALYLERFKPELPGWVLLKKRGLYSLALSRFWLDELYGKLVIEPCKRLGHLLDRLDTNVIDRAAGARAPAGKIRTAVSAWEDQYLGLQTNAAATGRLEEKVLANERGVAGWLTGLAATDAAWVERRLTFEASGVLGRVMNSAAAFAGGVEKHVIGRGGVSGLPKTAEFSSVVATRVEKQFDRGIHGGLSELNEMFAALANWMERVVFERGVHEGLPATSRILGRFLVRTEEALARPVVTGGLLVASVVAVLVGVLMWS